MAMAGPFLARARSRTSSPGWRRGERIVTVALHDMTGDVTAPALTAKDGKLTGTKTNVPFGTVADAFLVSAVDGVYLVEKDAPGVSVVRAGRGRRHPRRHRHFRRRRRAR